MLISLACLFLCLLTCPLSFLKLMKIQQKIQCIKIAVHQSASGELQQHLQLRLD